MISVGRQESDEPTFLQQAGEMGELIGSFDWERTGLGELARHHHL